MRILGENELQFCVRSDLRSSRVLAGRRRMKGYEMKTMPFDGSDDFAVEVESGDAENFAVEDIVRRDVGTFKAVASGFYVEKVRCYR